MPQKRQATRGIVSRRGKSLSAVPKFQPSLNGICDAISLLYKSDPSKEDLEGMDLFLVSEIKRPKDGSMEIKFFDRLKALEKLGAGGEHETGAKQLFDAISNSARAVNDKENGN